MRYAGAADDDDDDDLRLLVVMVMITCGVYFKVLGGEGVGKWGKLFYMRCMYVVGLSLSTL